LGRPDAGTVFDVSGSTGLDVKAIVCLAGSIGAGKSTVTKELAECLPGSVVRSFGDVVRAEARALGRPTDRHTLQEVGLLLIEGGWPQFVDLLLEGLDDDVSALIVDGTRHVPPVDELRSRYPQVPTYLVFVQVESEVSRDRLSKRGEAPSAMSHLIESELGAVEVHANLVVDGTLPIDAIIGTICQLPGVRSLRKVQGE